MFFDLVIQIHNMQNVHELTFVLVQTLNLYIEDRTRVYLNAVVLQNVFCKAHLVLIFDIHELLLCLLVIRINLQLGELCQVCHPSVSDMVCHPVCQQRVAVKQETSLCDTVRLVVEFVRIHLVEILQFLFFQDFRMQPCNTVYRIAACNGQMSHLNLAVIDDGHFADFLLVARIFIVDLLDESAVDLLNDLVDTGKQLGEQLNRPFFQCFCHNGMVCVSAGMGCDLPCLLPGHAFLVQKDTHKLRNCHGRMCII